MTKKNKSPEPQPPEKLTGIKKSAPSSLAGGLTAVKSSMQHIMNESGLVRGTKALLKVNQMDGFDCPGCAWPDPDEERSTIEFCENGAKAVAEETTQKQLDSSFFKKHSIQELSTWSDRDIGKSGRMTSPMVVFPGDTHYSPISWGDAFSMIGAKLNQLEEPDQAIFYTSGRTSNEAAFMYQLFVRAFGTNNLPDCSNMCHESSGVALSETVGIGKGSVKLEDFDLAEVIMIVGQNPGTNHPRMLTALQSAKKKGSKIVSINPLKEAGLLRFKHPQSVGDVLGSGTTLTDLYLQVKINGDVPLIKAMLKLLVDKEKKSPGTVFDHEFIKDSTQGLDALLEDLDNHELSTLVAASGVSMAEIQAVVDLIADKEKIIICWAMGVTQHKNAVDNIRELVNLLLLKGSIGKPGAGTCPVRGHSNVQGDRTMGIYEKPSTAFLDSIERTFDFEPPRRHGYDTVEAIQAMTEGRAKVFIAMGGNFLSATPDTVYTAKGLQQCELTVQISTKLNRSHLIHGKTALILPCLGRTEQDEQNGHLQFVTVENSAGVVHSSKGSLPPVSEHLLSEPRIVAGMAEATLKKLPNINWQVWANNYDLIRDNIESTIPGFESYNEKVRRPGGFYLPNGARERSFATITGKANFSINRVPEHRLAPEDYLMMTIRSHDQYNTTIYGLDDRYRGIYNERRIVLMNREDMDRNQLKEGGLVDLHSNYDDELRVAKGFLVQAYDIPRQCIATYFPEANVLIPVRQFADKSQTPISKSVLVRIVT